MLMEMLMARGSPLLMAIGQQDDAVGWYALSKIACCLSYKHTMPTTPLRCVSLPRSRSSKHSAFMQRGHAARFDRGSSK